jgi:CheY-like chemotaxis protein
VTPTYRGILLVEDNAADVEFILASLDGAGLTEGVRVARDGVEALEQLGCTEPTAAEPTDTLPRLVILDVKLPRINGLEVLQRLRAHPRTREVPVVMFTSSNIARDVAECYRLGANSYVQKPVEFERFRDVVRQLGVYWLSLNEPPRGQRGARRAPT